MRYLVWYKHPASPETWHTKQIAPHSYKNYRFGVTEVKKVSLRGRPWKGSVSISWKQSRFHFIITWNMSLGMKPFWIDLIQYLSAVTRFFLHLKNGIFQCIHRCSALCRSVPSHTLSTVIQDINSLKLGTDFFSPMLLFFMNSRRILYRQNTIA